MSFVQVTLWAWALAVCLPAAAAVSLGGVARARGSADALAAPAGKEDPCAGSAVWLQVLEEGARVAQRIVDNSPIGVCVLWALRSPTADPKRTFFERKAITVHDYLLDRPGVEFVVLTDPDVWVNPLSWQEVQHRFEQVAVAGKSRVVLATEQTCWFGRICAIPEATQWLTAQRLHRQRPDIHTFFNSQYAGDRGAVLKLLNVAFNLTLSSRGLPIVPHPDDMTAIAAATLADPAVAAVDFDEQLFASMSRGYQRGPGHLVCNFGGSNTTRCGDLPGKWGGCALQDGMRKLWIGGHWTAPLVTHFNGDSILGMFAGESCWQVHGDMKYVAVDPKYKQSLDSLESKGRFDD